MGLKKQLLAWKDIFLSIHTFSRFLTIQAVFLKGWPLRAAVNEKVVCLRILLKKSTFPKAIFSAETLKCLRIRAQPFPEVYTSNDVMYRRRTLNFQYPIRMTPLLVLSSLWCLQLLHYSFPRLPACAAVSPP
jgi:hypothetical protein